MDFGKGVLVGAIENEEKREEFKVEIGFSLIELVDPARSNESLLLKSIKILRSEEFPEMPKIRINDNLVLDANQFNVVWRNSEESYTFAGNESNEEKAGKIIDTIKAVYEKKRTKKRLSRLMFQSKRSSLCFMESTTEFC